METNIDKKTRVISLLCTFFLALALFAFFNASIAKVVVFNPPFWRTFLFNEDVIDVMYEEGDLDITSLDTIRCLQGIDDDARKELNIIVLDAVFEGMDGKDPEIDEDILDEFFDENIERELKHRGLSNSDIREEKEEFIEEINQEIDDLFDDMAERDFLDIMDSAKTASNIAFYGFLGVIGILVAILFAVHQNKFRPLSSIGVSFLLSGFLVLGIWSLIKWLLTDATANDATERALMGSIHNTLGVIIAVCVGMIILGIALIIVGGKLVREYEQNIEDGYEGYSYRGNDYE